MITIYLHLPLRSLTRIMRLNIPWTVCSKIELTLYDYMAINLLVAWSVTWRVLWLPSKTMKSASTVRQVAVLRMANGPPRWSEIEESLLSPGRPKFVNTANLRGLSCKTSWGISVCDLPHSSQNGSPPRKLNPTKYLRHNQWRKTVSHLWQSVRARCDDSPDNHSDAWF